MVSKKVYAAECIANAYFDNFFVEEETVCN